MLQAITPQSIEKLLQERAPHLSVDERMKQVIEISVSAFIAIIDKIFTSDEEKRLAVDAFKLSSSDHSLVVKYTEILAKRISELSPEARTELEKEYKAYVEEACDKLATAKNE